MSCITTRQRVCLRVRRRTADEQKTAREETNFEQCGTFLQTEISHYRVEPLTVDRRFFAVDCELAELDLILSPVDISQILTHCFFVRVSRKVRSVLVLRMT